MARCYRGYFDFKGRASRADYNWFIAWICLLLLGMSPLNAAISEWKKDRYYAVMDRPDATSEEKDRAFRRFIANDLAYTLLGLVILIFVPGYAVAARRGHDLGLPTAQGIAMFMTPLGLIWMMFLKGEPWENDYGPPL